MCYRSYVYDNESEFYYLQSRYYDPATGRFINADIYIDNEKSIFGTNMFAYCDNNTVNKFDDTGEASKYLKYKIGQTVWVTSHDEPTFKKFNCYAYALRNIRKWINPGYFSGVNASFNSKYYSLTQITQWVSKDLKKLGRKYKLLMGRESTPAHKTKPENYLIAIRVSSKTLFNKTGEYDYHFMRRTLDNCWRFKAGGYGKVMQLVKGCTPSNVTWDAYGSSTGNCEKYSYKVVRKAFYTGTIDYMVVSYNK